MKIIGQTVRIWHYRVTGIVPTEMPAGQIEAAVRSCVSWNDIMLSSLRGTEVTEETLDEKQAQQLMAEFKDRLSGH